VEGRHVELAVRRPLIYHRDDVALLDDRGVPHAQHNPLARHTSVAARDDVRRCLKRPRDHDPNQQLSNQRPNPAGGLRFKIAFLNCVLPRPSPPSQTGGQLLTLRLSSGRRIVVDRQASRSMEASVVCI